jgi:hypothetical protein
MRVLIDIRTNRVVWFTEGDEDLPLAANVAHVDYKGEWPEGCKTTNCWNWVLRDRRIVPFEKETDEEKLSQINLRHCYELLNEKIRLQYGKITLDALIDYWACQDAQEFLASGTASAFLARAAVAWEIGLTEAANRVIGFAKNRKEMVLSGEAIRIAYDAKLQQAAEDNDALLALHEEIAALVF